MSRFFIIVLVVLCGGACGHEGGGLEGSLKPGTRLATEVVLGRAHTYPLEPMSPTSAVAIS